MIHIACNIDHNYVRYCAVTLVSACFHNREEGITAHIVGRGLTHDDKRLLQASVEPYGGKLLYYVPSEKLLDGFAIKATHNRISLATYYRCFLSDMLPATLSRVLYLDCDIVVCGDLLPLWQSALDGVGAAVVEDMGCRDVRRYEALAYPAEEGYFNAGVMLINLDFWRAKNMAAACTAFYKAHPERIIFNDQDLLNCVLHDSKRFVDLQWNVQDGFYRRSHVFSKDHANHAANILRHPRILHFTNRKPWSYDSQHPLRSVWFRYLDLTPFRGERPWHNPLNILRRFFRLLPFRIGLRRPKYVQL